MPRFKDLLPRPPWEGPPIPKLMAGGWGKRLFHVTRLSYIGSIKGEGLIPGARVGFEGTPFYETDYLWFWDDLEVATNVGWSMYRRGFAVVVVDERLLDKEQLFNVEYVEGMVVYKDQVKSEQIAEILEYRR